MEPYRHRVQYYETDRMQVTHHSNYIRFMEEARTDFLERIGWGYDRMEAEGVISPVIGVTCEYKKMTTFADNIDITIKVLECKGVKLKLGYTMRVKDVVVCEGTSTHCFLNAQGRPISYAKEYPEFWKLMKQLQEDCIE